MSSPFLKIPLPVFRRDLFFGKGLSVKDRDGGKAATVKKREHLWEGENQFVGGVRVGRENYPPTGLPEFTKEKRRGIGQFFQPADDRARIDLKERHFPHRGAQCFGRHCAVGGVILVKKPVFGEQVKVSHNVGVVAAGS